MYCRLVLIKWFQCLWTNSNKTIW